jgi:hypothetical protein
VSPAGRGTLMLFEIPDSKDILKDDLLAIGNWTIANVTSSTGGWPVTLQEVNYNGVRVWVLPVMKDRAPALAVNRPAGFDRGDAERLLMRLASAISWITRSGIIIEDFSGGSRCFLTQRREGEPTMIRKDFDLSYLPEPTDKRALLALALMREGKGLNHAAYGFLSYYRVLEVALPDGKKRGKWISDNVEKLRDIRAKEGVAKLKRGGVGEIGKHLVKSGRQAIAHAAKDPIINPDDPAHMRRLHGELPIISSLAELAIEQELGVETSHTVWEKHLYELAGFKKAFGKELVDAITSGAPIAEGRTVNLPVIDVELRMQPPYTPLCGLYPKSMEAHGGSVTVYFESEDGRFGFRCVLEFAAERLHFDIGSDIRADDDQTAEGAAHMAEIGRFMRDYWGNGELRIVDSATREVIARKDGFMPLNCYLDLDAANAGIEHWKAMARVRSAAQAAGSEQISSDE